MALGMVCTNRLVPPSLYNHNPIAIPSPYPCRNSHCTLTQPRPYFYPYINQKAIVSLHEPSSDPTNYLQHTDPANYLNHTSFLSHSEEPPDVTLVRCIPEKWCAPTTTRPTKVWDDTGAGGGKPGSIWTINNMDMIAVVPGHDAPKEQFFELKSQRFFIDQFVRTEAGVVYFT